MKKGNKLIAIIVIAVIIVAGIFLFRKSGNASNSGNPSGGSEASLIILNNYTLTPSNLTITVGTEVTWRNEQVSPQAIRSNTGVFQSPTLKQGEEYTFKFTEAGTYVYRLVAHPGIKGTIIVQ